MPLASATTPSSTGRLIPTLFLASVVLVTLSASACNQEPMTQDVTQDVTTDVTAQESATAEMASFIADLEVMREKFLALAEAFPEDTYTWRPMDGVRSVSEVLMLHCRRRLRVRPDSTRRNGGHEPGGIGRVEHGYRQGTGDRSPNQGLCAREDGTRGDRFPPPWSAHAPSSDKSVRPRTSSCSLPATCTSISVSSLPTRGRIRSCHHGASEHRRTSRLLWCPPDRGTYTP